MEEMVREEIGDTMNSVFFVGWLLLQLVEVSCPIMIFFLLGLDLIS